MKQNTKQFLLELAALLDKYKVEIEITESCKSCNSWNGFSVDGLEFDIPWIEEGGFPRNDYVELSGRFHCSTDIFDYVEKHIDD